MQIFCTQLYAGGNVNQFTLDNGIQVLHKKIDSNPIITLQVFLRGGIINDKKELAGLANLTQVLMTKATKTRNSERLSNDIEDIGANLSLDVDYDSCRITITVTDPHIEKAAEILSDIIRNPAFDDKEIEKERTNILAGIDRREDSIFNVANDLLNKTFYAGHPYSWTNYGTKETVSKIKKDDILAFHKILYTSGNIFIVIAGDIELGDAENIIKKYFTSIPSSQEKLEKPVPEMPAPKKVLKELNKFKQAYLMIAYPAPSIQDPDYSVLKVINTVLGGRMTSRLFVELREKLSLAYEVSSFYPSRKELSKFVIYIGLNKKNLGLTKKRIAELIDDLKNKEIDNKELSETKNYIKGVFLLEHQTVVKQAWYLGWWEIMGKGHNYDQAYLDDLMKVSPEEIKKAANKYFKDNYVQVEIVPE